MNTQKCIDNIRQELDNLEMISDKHVLKDNDDLKQNEFIFEGTFENKAGNSISFKSSGTIASMLDFETEDAAVILGAFGNYERLKIIILLLDNKYTANELMEILNFKTTGKLYHHLNALISADIIFKSEEHFLIKGSRIQGILAILLGCHCYISKYRDNCINTNELKKD